MSRPPPRCFLEGLDNSIFDVPQMTSIEVYTKSVGKLALRDDLAIQITRARFVGCRLSGLPEGLAACKNIVTLDVTDNQIEVLPQNALATFTSLQTLDLTANLVRSVDFALPCTLESLVLSFNPELDLKSIWTRELPNLKQLKVTHCRIQRLPEEIPPWSRTLESLYLDGNHLIEIPAVLKHFSSLTELSLHGNKIEKIDNLNLPQPLKTLNLAFNELVEFGSGNHLNVNLLCVQANLFRTFPENVLNLEDLRTVLLSKCNIEGVIDVVLPSNVAGIDLAGNNIEGFSERFISSLAQVSGLNISGNRITELPDCFPENHSISHFFCDNNMLTSLPPSLLQARRIEVFSCVGNRLESLSGMNMPRLVSLNLSFNNLKELPDEFRVCTSMTDMNISFNQLTDLPKSLGGCRKLMILIAASNRFERVPRVIFAFSQLKTLVLSGNRLTNLSQSFGSFFFLKTLDMSNNHFREFPEVLLRLKSLRNVSFSHNLIKNLSIEFPNLVLLDFSFNRLQSVSLNLPQAGSVSLDYNQLKTFDFTSLANCQFLSLNFNPIEQTLINLLPDFLSMSSLRCLELIRLEPEAVEPPPLRFHLLEGYHSTFPRNCGVGYSATLGDRPAMEDAVAIRALDDKSFVCGVFDGHSGNISASVSAMCVCNECRSLLGKTDEEIKSGFAQVFTRINDKLKLMKVTDGCTAVCAVVHNGKCFVAGVGDARVVLVRSSTHERMTIDSKPTNRSELRRLREMNLMINSEGRINRKLAVSRSLGDFWCGDGLYVEPDVSQIEIGDDDVGLILACDGLWDVLRDEDAADVVRRSTTAASAAVQLKSYAFALGSKDNISVVVVKFHAEAEDCGMGPRNTVEEIPVIPEVDDEPFDIPVSPDVRRRRR